VGFWGRGVREGIKSMKIWIARPAESLEGD
jgi:hypothetical protein